MTTLLTTMRPPFLLLTPVSLAPAFALMYTQQGGLDALSSGLVMLAALCAHISVNMFNEYLDFRSGLDAMTERTPFSGGSGALVADPDAATRVRTVAWLSLSTCIAAGLVLVRSSGIELLPLGLLGVLIILSYTPWLNRHPLLCLLAPGLAFGPLMICGSVFVLGGGYSLQAALLSLAPFFMVNNLLLLNQFPDIEADRRAGRDHLPIRHGIEPSLAVYRLFTIAAAAVILLPVIAGALPGWCAITLLPVLSALFVHAGLRERHAEGTTYTDLLGSNVIIVLLTPVCLAAGLLIANIQA